MENCPKCLEKDDEINNLNEGLNDLEKNKDEIIEGLQEQLGEAIDLLNEIKRMLLNEIKRMAS